MQVQSSLPAMPPLDERRLEEHRACHGAVAESMASVGPSVRELFRRSQRRIIIESLASVELVVGDHLLPPHRRFLSRAARDRLRGCEVAFRHVDSRLTMWREGHLADAVGVETPRVVHALAESHDPDRRETNPGLVRAQPVWFDATESSFEPPPGDRCDHLLDAAVAMATEAPAPAVARAGWLCSTILAIHPFVDGNGRTARLLFHAVNSSDLAVGVDWGSLEVWTRRRRAYIAALKESQASAIEGSGLAAVDAAPFMTFALDSSIDGARLIEQRLRGIDAAWSAAWESDSDAARLLETAVHLDATATVAELATLVAEPHCSTLIDELVDRGRLAWSGDLLRVGPEHPLRHTAGG